MIAYTIFPGNIAAVCYVRVADAPQHLTYVYLDAEKIDGSPNERSFYSLPFKVRAAVESHFSAIFALPLMDRGLYLKQCGPLVIEAES